MKILAFAALVASASIVACSSEVPTDVPTDLAPSFASGSGSDGSGSDRGGSDGSGGDGGDGEDDGGSGSSGGGTVSTGPSQNVFVNRNPLVSGDTSSLLVSVTDVAPAGGYALSLRSNDAAVQVPATYVVPAGEFVVHVPLSTTPIANARVFSVTVSLLGQSKSNGAKLFPRTATLAAPTLLSPGDRSGFGVRRVITFDWNDQNNAWCYQIQMDDDPAFTGYPAYGEVCTPYSFWNQSAFGPLGSTNYWRVRAQDASGNPGPWSPVRSFVIK
jgi:hypothetical protein